MTRLLLLPVVLLLGCSIAPTVVPATRPVSAVPPSVTPVTTAVPFPRGLVRDGDTLYVLSRGRVRDAGGTDVAVDDRAGSVWAVDLASGAAREAGVATDPPFRLLDRSLPAALDDVRTDRPYCILRRDPATGVLYFCAFSGIDKPIDAYAGAGDRQYFRKNRSDALFSFDPATGKYAEVFRGPPLDGPNNCYVWGDTLLVANKEASSIVGIDLSTRKAVVLAGREFDVEGLGRQTYLGHSMIAVRDGWVYLGFRTSSVILRVRESDLRRAGGSGAPLRAQLLAVFDPFDRATGVTADLTDMAFDDAGDLYVVSAKPARLFRFRPDPRRVPDFRGGKGAWADLFVIAGKPKMKIESLLVEGRGRVLVTSADAAPGQPKGWAGTVYRVRE